MPPWLILASLLVESLGQSCWFLDGKIQKRLWSEGEKLGSFMMKGDEADAGEFWITGKINACQQMKTR